MEIIDLFSLGFIQRALIGGLLTALLTSFMGILVVLRRSSFFGDAIAHSALTGVALGLLINFDPLIVASLYVIFIAVVLPFLRKHSGLPIDSLLGFVLPFSMGLGVWLLTFIPGYQPELISFLFGSILAISWSDVFIIFTLLTVIFFSMGFLGKKLVFSLFDPQYAKLTGINVDMIEVVYHILLAITIVAGIRLVGIILVNALLVVPARSRSTCAGTLRRAVCSPHC